MSRGWSVDGVPAPEVVIRACRDCHRTFEIDPAAQAWFQIRGLSLPARCQPCRHARRNQVRT